LFRKTPLKAQNDYIFYKFWGRHGYFGPPLATPMLWLSHRKFSAYAIAGNTVQQHQCGKQSIAGDRLCTVYSSKQLRNSAKLQIDKILPKFCNMFFIKRFILTLDPTLMCYLNLLYKI